MTLAAAALLLGSMLPSAAQDDRRDRLVRTGPGGVSQVTGGGGFIAWSGNTPKRPNRYDVYVRPAGGEKFRVARRRWRSSLGGIDGRVLVYQENKGGVSDIKLFNLRSGKRRDLPSVNTKRWEYWPSKSGRFVLFGRIYPAAERRGVFLQNLRTNELTRLAWVPVGQYLAPGQVNGDWAVWNVWNPERGKARVFRLNIPSGNVREAPLQAFAWGPSVTHRGTVFFGATGKDCGENARLMRWRGGNRSQTVLRLPARTDLSDTFVHTTNSGKIQVLHNRIDCDDLATGSDMYRFVDRSTLRLRITLEGNGGGHVSGRGIACPEDCVQFYEPGALAKLVATPDERSRLESWSDVACSGDTCEVTMNSDKDITATFRRGE